MRWARSMASRTTHSPIESRSPYERQRDGRRAGRAFARHLDLEGHAARRPPARRAGRGSVDALRRSAEMRHKLPSRPGAPFRIPAPGPVQRSAVLRPLRRAVPAFAMQRASSQSRSHTSVSCTEADRGRSTRRRERPPARAGARADVRHPPRSVWGAARYAAARGSYIATRCAPCSHKGSSKRDDPRRYRAPRSHRADVGRIRATVAVQHHGFRDVEVEGEHDRDRTFDLASRRWAATWIGPLRPAWGTASRSARHSRKS